tara:strand:+ start:192 stop:422 length:231 start_codon:yes stop_codon:yes gene_type:complete
LIEVTKKTTYKVLSDRITSALEERYDHLKALKGLRVKELKLQNNSKEQIKKEFIRQQSNGDLDEDKSIHHLKKSHH